jgi:two-component system OmpR family sensor kinase
MTLRTRIIIGFGVVLALIAALGVTVVVAQRQQLTDQLDRRLAAVIPLDRPAPQAPGAAPRPADPDGDRPAAEPISDIYIAAVFDDLSVDVLVQGQLLDAVPDLAGLAELVRGGRTFTTIDAVDGSTQFRVLLDPMASGTVTTVIAVPTADVDETVQRLATTFAVVALLVAAILAMVAWWIIRLGFRPISAMTETAHAISAGDRNRRAPEFDERTEASELAGAFNLMLDQRDQAEDRLRRFASDASHELRTPLTSIQGYLDLYARGGFREPGQLDDVVRRMRAEAGRMGVLVEELLQLTRLDEGQTLDIAPVDVGGFVRDVVADALAGHPHRSVVAQAPAEGEAMVEIDHNKIRQLITVLVDNALTHAPDADVEVRAATTDQQLVITVADNGPGLSEQEASQVFTRFYRGDSSRARTTGGSGLGLAIAESIAAAHDGTIELRTAPGQGCEFTVRIPTPAAT